MYHKVIPLYNGNLTVKFGKYSDLEVVKATDFKIHNFIFLIVGEDGEPVVVDTGFSKENIFGFDSVCERTEGQEVNNAIAAHGFDTEKIRDVILTHIHWDHTGGMKYFPNSKFYAQAEDFRFLLKMDPHDETAYYTDHWLSRLDDFVVVDGTYELKPGIRMHFSGRHSSGHQIVEIDTRAGKVIIAGDELTSHRKFWESMPAEYWTDLKERYFETHYWTHDRLHIVEKWFNEKNPPLREHRVLKLPEIEKLGKYILFSHDPGLLKIESIPGTGR